MILFYFNPLFLIMTTPPLQLRCLTEQFVDNQKFKDMFRKFDAEYFKLKPREIIENYNVDVLKYVIFRNFNKKPREIIFWSYVLNKKQFIEFCKNNFPNLFVKTIKLEAYAYLGDIDKFTNLLVTTYTTNKYPSIQPLLNTCLIHALENKQVEMSIHIYYNIIIKNIKNFKFGPKHYKLVLMTHSLRCLRLFLPDIAVCLEDEAIYERFINYDSFYNELMNMSEEEIELIMSRSYVILVDKLIFGYGHPFNNKMDEIIKFILYKYFDKKDKKIIKFISQTLVFILNIRQVFMIEKFSSNNYSNDEKEEFFDQLKKSDEINMLDAYNSWEDFI